MHFETETAVNGGHSPPQPTTPPPVRRLVAPAPARRRQRFRVYPLLKRGLDILLALALLILTAPLLLFGMAVVKLTSRGPVFYWQTRMGRGGKPFTIYKIRTMYHECEKDSGARWCKPGDPRIIPLGRFLRRAHIDELPQLWNILIGDMSLIGPRPERPEFLPQLERALPRYRDRLDERPGLTGLAQVQLPPDTDLNSARTKLAYDLWYVEKMGFWLDLRILVGTVLHVLCLPWGAVRFCLAFPRRQTIESAFKATLAPEPKPVAPSASVKSSAPPAPVYPVAECELRVAD
jgi:lipopolysaccharide/colanic/teichoic acid biosynthesis glycosyltransferase